MMTDAILFFGFSFCDTDKEEFAWEKDEWDNLCREADNLGFKISYHGADEYPIWYISFAFTEVKASLGFPMEVGSLPEHEDSQIDDLHDFCDKHGINWQYPHWWLASRRVGAKRLDR